MLIIIKAIRLCLYIKKGRLKYQKTFFRLLCTSNSY